MLGPSHFCAGALSGLLFAAATNATPGRALLLVAGGAVGGLCPDIDTPSSTIARWCLRLSPVAALLAYRHPQTLAADVRTRLACAAAAALCFALLPVALRLLVGHRGPLHALPVWGAGFALAAHFSPSLPFLGALVEGIFLGALAGGVLPDMLTPAGTAALWPLTRRRFRLAPRVLCVNTGGWMESFVIRPLLGLALVMTAALYAARHF